MIWFVLAAFSIAAILILLYPLIQKGKSESSREDIGLDVFKRQLSELEADLERGVVTAEDAEATRIEIKRRILKAGKSKGTAFGELQNRPVVVATILGLITLGGSFGLYSVMGSPEVPSSPLAARDIEAEKRQFAGQNLNTLVKRLAERLQEQPDNLDGWVLLGRTLSRMQRYEDAAKTYLQATTIAPQDADLYVGAGENYYFLAKGIVSDASLSSFAKALSINPKHPGARYYMAVYDFQSGQKNEALEKWIALFQESDAAAPFMPVLRDRIEKTAAEIGEDVTAILAAKPLPEPENGPSREQMQAAAELNESDRQQMINDMVAGLEERMKEAPEFEGLMRLGKAYSVQQKFDKSADAYGRAANLKPDSPEPLVFQALALVQGSEGAELPDGVVDIYRKVLSLDDRIPEAHWYVGIAEAKEGNSDKAIGHWKKILQLVPEDSKLHSNVTRAINSLSQTPQN